MNKIYIGEKSENRESKSLNTKKFRKFKDDFMEVPRKGYSHKSFQEEVIENFRTYLKKAEEKDRKELKVICLLAEEEIWDTIFKRNADIENYGEMLKYSIPYSEDEGERKEAVYYGFFDSRNSLIYFYTDINMDVFRKTLDHLIQRTLGIYYLWMSPDHFNLLKNCILEKYTNTQISYFTAKRKYHFKECEIRPEYERTMTYWGEDGKETLKEMEFYYGISPQILEFLVDLGLGEKMRFRISNECIFTLRTSHQQSLDMFFETLNEIIPMIIKIKELFSDVKFEYEQMVSKKGSIEIPSIESAQIELSRKINLIDIENIVNGLGKQSISVVNSNTEVGSFAFSATVVDDLKGTVYGINVSDYYITLIPKLKNSFDSFMKFYRFILENIDQKATIKKFSELYG